VILSFADLGLLIGVKLAFYPAPYCSEHNTVCDRVGEAVSHNLVSHVYYHPVPSFICRKLWNPDVSKTIHKSNDRLQQRDDRHVSVNTEGNKKKTKGKQGNIWELGIIILWAKI
jgi:hypothetical protein